MQSLSVLILGLLLKFRAFRLGDARGLSDEHAYGNPEPTDVDPDAERIIEHEEALLASSIGKGDNSTSKHMSLAGTVRRNTMPAQQPAPPPGLVAPTPKAEQKVHEADAHASSPAAKVAPASPSKAEVAQVKAHAANAHEAAEVAKQAAVVANNAAEHSVKVSGHAKEALHHALGALHSARAKSDLNTQQEKSLKKAEDHLREASKTAEYGKLQKVEDARELRKAKMQSDLDRSLSAKNEKEEMLREIQNIREKLQQKEGGPINEELQRSLDKLEAEVKQSDGPINDEHKAELERLREEVDKLEDRDPTDHAQRYFPVAAEEESEATPVEEKGIDIDTQMPYGDLEPFGREDTAQELTEHSVTESDEMVDQLERAEVAEEKRAVFRALTRLRGAAITSFDGIARSQTGNIDEYNKLNKWRKTHPVHHLADEESDVTRWAFPDNADFVQMKAHAPPRPRQEEIFRFNEPKKPDVSKGFLNAGKASPHKH